MPELPEVETSRRGIEPWLVGHTIMHTVIRNTRLRWPVAPEITSLRDKMVLSVHRRAKYLLIELNDAGWIIIHLGMSGSLQVVAGDSVAQQHDHIDVVMSSGKILRYRDPRRFGAWLWSHDPKQCRLLARLGPEPLEQDFNDQYLFARSQNKRAPVKLWLMDNTLVAGIGNIYASESLFSAAILPDRPANTLTKTEASVLVASIKTVLSRAIAQGGTTLRDFLQSDGKPGYFTQELQVYGRAGGCCHRCGGLIAMARHRQRSTFFCPQCQH